MDLASDSSSSNQHAPVFPYLCMSWLLQVFSSSKQKSGQDAYEASFSTPYDRRRKQIKVCACLKVWGLSQNKQDGGWLRCWPELEVVACWSFVVKIGRKIIRDFFVKDKLKSGLTGQKVPMFWGAFDFRPSSEKR